MLVATRSVGKLRELLPLFAAEGVEVETLDDAGLAASVEEDTLEAYETFEANALAKARWFHAQSGGRLVVADDSGLMVDALGGAPGVRSKRWSNRADLDGVALDHANNAHLQSMLTRAEAVGQSDRSARYVCAAAAVWSGGECVVRGTTEGAITRVASGDGGFGYDPYFVSDVLGLSFGMATRDAKSAISHRGRAFALLVAMLRDRGVLHSAGGMTRDG